jgi:hypothetical protein
MLGTSPREDFLKAVKEDKAQVGDCFEKAALSHAVGALVS